MFTETPEAQAIIAWYDSQTEEFLASLPGYEDGLTPRQAWAAFCSLPAEKQPGEGLAAPAEAGQGAGIALTDDQADTKFMISNELTVPEGFWFSLHCNVCWFPSPYVREARRA